MKKLFLILVVLSLLFTGCAKKEPPPPNYPDFSTPEAAFNTTFYAAKYKDYPVYLDSMTESGQQKYGKTRAEQIAILEKYGKKIPIRRNRTRTITKIEYVKNPEYDVMVAFVEKKGSEFSMRWWVPFKKINGKWVEPVIKEREPKK
jgi:hypothetical protein